MTDQDFLLFREKLQEMNDIFRRDLPLTDSIVKHCTRVCKHFSLAIVRQACDDLIDTADFFPKPAELKRACERYGFGGSRDEVARIRCGFMDFSRDPLPDDAFERHWRCPAWFPLVDQQTNCPQHRLPTDQSPEYGPPATPEEISEVFAEALAAHPNSRFMREVCADRAKRLAQGEHPVQAAIKALTSAIGETMPDVFDGPDVIKARKEGQLARARAAGLEV